MKSQVKNSSAMWGVQLDPPASSPATTCWLPLLDDKSATVRREPLQPQRVIVGWEVGGGGAHCKSGSWVGQTPPTALWVGSGRQS